MKHPITVRLLTPPGTGAISVLELRGATSWDMLRQIVKRPSGLSLPMTPRKPGHWFGSVGEGVGDEVVIVLQNPPPDVRAEVHGHGGRRVTEWLLTQFKNAGAVVVDAWKQDDQAAPVDQYDNRALPILAATTTERTARIALDQYHRAFQNACQRILVAPSLEGLPQLAQYADLGEHLIRPWRISIIGAPNAGKSTLLNALLGYQRSIISDQAGTTRDVVRASSAVDGWPVQFCDTAGLRVATDCLEVEGIALAKRALQQSELVLWVADASTAKPLLPEVDTRIIVVANKADLPTVWNPTNTIRVSALTNTGLEELTKTISQRLVPNPPDDSPTAVPFTLELASAIRRAEQHRSMGQLEVARKLVEQCLHPKIAP